MFTTVKVLTVTESTFGLTGWSIVLSLSQIPSWVKPKTLAMEYDNFLPDIKKKRQEFTVLRKIDKIHRNWSATWKAPKIEKTNTMSEKHWKKFKYK